MTAPHRCVLAAFVAAACVAACTPASPPADVAAPPAASAPAAPAPAPAVASPPDDPALTATRTVTFDGVAGAAFGGHQVKLATAWPGALAEEVPDEAGGCHYLYVQPKPLGRFDIAFMVEDDRFVRVDVDTPDIEAPGGGRVGMTADAVRATHENVTEQPHKYVEGGRYLVVPHPEGGGTTLVFEVDAAGVVTAWRVGLPPQVHYVEGCA